MGVVLRVADLNVSQKMKRIVTVLCALLGFAPISRESDTDKLAAYLKLVKEERWAEALPVIEEIVQLKPKIATSWFNRGVCLDGLLRHKEAAESFRRAYALKPDDYGAQYRTFRSLALDEHYAAFAAFLEDESKKMPEVFDLLQEDKLFSKALSAKPVKDVLEKRRKG
jgi:tetratricopeptide (TPR) repeat protein